MRAKTKHQAIPVLPEEVRILGHDFVAAIYYRQMIYYDLHEPKDAEGYFKKSKSAISRSTALTRYQQDRARRKLVEVGWIAVRLEPCAGSQTSFIRVLRHQ